MRFLLPVTLLLCGLSARAQFGVQLDGKPHTQLAPPGTKVVVLYFIASDCPISNRLLPDMQDLAYEFQGQPVAFYTVYANTTETRFTIAAHRRDYSVRLDALTDAAGELVALTHAYATPQAVVLVPDGSGWKVVYSGRINDKFVSLGVEKPHADHHELERTLDEALLHKPMHAVQGKPVGCAIVNPKARVPAE